MIANKKYYSFYRTYKEIIIYDTPVNAIDLLIQHHMLKVLMKL